jgi:YVTN family beta-propeller protein
MIIQRVILTAVLLALCGCGRGMPGHPEPGPRPKLLTVHKLADSFGIYDMDSGALVAEIPTSVKPHEFALGPDKRYAFITDYGVDTYTDEGEGGNTITIVDLHTRKVDGTISTGEYRRPHAIELLPSGLFYVTTEKPAAVHVVDPRARKVLHTIPVAGELPHMIYVKHDESKAWTADSGSGTVSVVDLKARKQVGTIETGGVPMGFAVTKDESELFLATREGNEIVVLDPGADTVKERISMPGRPGRLLMSPDGKLLLVACIGSDEAVLLDVATRKELARAGQFKRAEGMAMHPAGQSFFLSAQMDNRIVRLSLPDLKVMQKIETKAKPDPIVIWTPAR